MSALRAAIADLYGQVSAPSWAAPNLDALADVLRDLSWLPPGSVTVRWPAVPGLVSEDVRRLSSVLMAMEAATADGDRPVLVLVG